MDDRDKLPAERIIEESRQHIVAIRMACYALDRQNPRQDAEWLQNTELIERSARTLWELVGALARRLDSSPVDDAQAALMARPPAPDERNH